MALSEAFVKEKRLEDDIGRMIEGCAGSGVFVEVKDISIVGRRCFLYLCSCWLLGWGGAENVSKFQSLIWRNLLIRWIRRLCLNLR